jgi:hypothetical protein
MHEKNAADFGTKLQSDSALREEFRRDPIRVAEQAGLQLTAEEASMAKSFASLDDTQMIERVSKFVK